MKLIAIGDVHGRDTWKQVDTSTADRIIFLGDYVDNRQGITDDTIYRNLIDIINLKRTEPDKIILLLGNHDAQYLHYPAYQCSGFRPGAQVALTALLTQHRDFFQIAYQEKNYLFTHAGVSNGWYQSRRNYLSRGVTGLRLADQLNAMYARDDDAPFLFDVGPARRGDADFGGPVWADRSETMGSYLPSYHQVVGHTAVSNITTAGDENGSITYCDVTQTKADFYQISL